MISYYKGNLLDSGCDIIAHQVNLQGIMGGGLARQIADRYPLCERAYRAFCKYLFDNQLGCVHKCEIYKKPIIMNCFSQEENFNTDYYAIQTCFKNILDYTQKNSLKTIGVPFKYGCGIAHGDWQKVEKIFKDIFENEPEIDFQIWELI